ncbi:hypothetical protein [Actinomadura sp. 9N407]|uniref:hypothetical protein n=1 Tax=Actinomadura sp. 9N407 TaxID=3375154 RepID=UPI00378F4572
MTDRLTRITTALAVALVTSVNSDRHAHGLVRHARRIRHHGGRPLPQRHLADKHNIGRRKIKQIITNLHQSEPPSPSREPSRVTAGAFAYLVFPASYDAMGFWEREDAEHRSWLDTKIEQVSASTLPIATRSFEEVGLVRGERCDDEREALRALKVSALEMGGDAILGVGFCGVASTANAFTQEGVKGEVFAYGTAVRWVNSDRTH